MKYIFTYIAVALFILPCFCGNIYFNHLGNTQGLPQINIMSIYQDETGAMWFGTIEGLCRYNGKETQIFRSSEKYPGLTKNNIMAITGNKKGSIYIKADYDLVEYKIAEEKFHAVLDNNVNEIFYKNGKLWIATNEGIFTYSDEGISLYSSQNNDEGTASVLAVSDDNKVWIGGRRGLKLIDPSGKESKKNNFLQGITINTIYLDKNNNVWAGTYDDGVYKFNEEGKLLAHHYHIPGQNSISNNQVRTIIEDDAGIIWIGTFFGLNSFDPETEKWTNYIHDDTQPHSLSHSSVFSIYNDKQGTLWIGTYFGGVNYFNPEYDIFQFYNASSTGNNNLSFPFVGKMAEDNNGNLWICTEGGGLNRLNLDSRQFSRYLYDGYDFESVSRYNLKAIYFEPSSNKLYLGIHNGGLCIFDINTNNYKIIRPSLSTKQTLPDYSIRDIKKYKNSLIFLTREGLSRMEINEEVFKPFSEDKELNTIINSKFIYQFHIDKENRLWFSSISTLRRIDLNTLEIKEYTYEKNNPNSIGKFRITSILETKNGDLFFGTIGSGLFRYCPETDSFENYTEENKSQISNFCYYISELPAGNLMLLHNDGFSIFDPKRKNTIYRSPNNFPITGFFEGSSAYITRNNEIFIGGTNGMASVNESKLINITTTDYPVYFDKLFINNKYVCPGDGTNVLRQTLPFCSEINLKYNQNNIAIEYATSNYSQADILNYEYKLENFDSEWNRASSNTIIYTNINPGEYNLLLREINPQINNEGVKIQALRINISPPLYKTALAYIIYLILFLTTIVGIIRFFVWRSQINSALEMERKEKEQNEKLNQMKFKFFTNISHELRTPLTLIIAQTESLLNTKNLEHNLKDKISKVLNNASHMRGLISELLDFRKQEQGYYDLKVEEVYLPDYIMDIYQAFTEYAKKHNISYKFEFPHEEEITVFIDKNQFKKAIYNLLSNAFKYTSDGGEITIRLHVDEYVSIEIEDNGIGISADALSRIFERFYQVEYRTSGFSLGTGIGLALTKEIVESHHGEIKVRSTVNEGSIFEIKLLKGHQHFESRDLKNITSLEITDIENKPIEEKNQNIQEEKELTDYNLNNNDNTDSPFSILIVEDNEELLMLLADAFSPKYKVFTATNGRVGLEMATEIIPDIILSDIMMPEMTGKEMCYKIKNTINLSHIPVVLLTSQDSVDQTIEGYMFGADDYVVKPFNMEILKTRCISLVKNRKLLYRNISNAEKSSIPYDIQSEHEEKFINKATEIIKQNFDNPDFDMNMLASELGIGRNRMYAKIKEITNLTPNEFTLNLKLQESVDMLKNYLHLNISEISIALGFSSTKYFSRCFKTYYGITPAQWRKDNVEKNYTSDETEDE